MTVEQTQTGNIRTEEFNIHPALRSHKTLSSASPLYPNLYLLIRSEYSLRSEYFFLSYQHHTK